MPFAEARTVGCEFLISFVKPHAHQVTGDRHDFGKHLIFQEARRSRDLRERFDERARSIEQLAGNTGCRHKISLVA